MIAMDLVKPWRIITGFLPILYGTLVILELQQSWLWLLIACTIIVLAVVAANALEYSILASWPAFAGIFCLVACIGALIQSLPNYGIIPITDSNIELWAAAVLAGGFIGWGLRTAQRFAESY